MRQALFGIKMSPGARLDRGPDPKSGSHLQHCCYEAEYITLARLLWAAQTGCRRDGPKKPFMREFTLRLPPAVANAQALRPHDVVKTAGRCRDAKAIAAARRASWWPFLFGDRFRGGDALDFLDTRSKSPSRISEPFTINGAV
jgi:hypothetical protein